MLHVTCRLHTQSRNRPLAIKETPEHGPGTHQANAGMRANGHQRNARGWPVDMKEKREREPIKET